MIGIGRWLMMANDLYLRNVDAGEYLKQLWRTCIDFQWLHDFDPATDSIVQFHERVPVDWQDVCMRLQPEQYQRLAHAVIYQPEDLTSCLQIDGIVFPDTMQTFFKRLQHCCTPLMGHPIYHRRKNRATVEFGGGSGIGSGSSTKVDSSADDICGIPAFLLNVNPKKKHEILQMADLYADVTHLEGQGNPRKTHTCNSVIDVGGGKGHLSRFLFYKPGFCNNVLCLDASEDNIRKGPVISTRAFRSLGRTYKEDQNDFFSQQVGLSQPPALEFRLTPPLTPDCEYLQNLLISTRQVTGSDGTTALLGLHACGELTNTLIRCIAYPSTDHLMVVGCCYNCAPSTSSNSPFRTAIIPCSSEGKALGLHLSSYSRFLALKSLDRWIEDIPESVVKMGNLNAYRVVLQEFLRKHFTSDIAQHFKVPKNESLPTDTFSSYAHAAMAKITELSTTGHLIMTQDYLEDFCHRTLPGQSWTSLFALDTLRVLCGVLLECIIVVDRFLSLQNLQEASSISSNDKHAQKIVFVGVTKLFNSQLSPRAFALVASKRKPANETLQNYSLYSATS